VWIPSLANADEADEAAEADEADEADEAAEADEADEADEAEAPYATEVGAATPNGERRMFFRSLAPQKKKTF
jgi:hypothetical protein